VSGRCRRDFVLCRPGFGRFRLALFWCRPAYPRRRPVVGRRRPVDCGEGWMDGEGG
jgi:hypothetical protein